ncbi:MAG TPA: tRNA-dihydrouridine synthase [Thermoleophilia bacterium]|nr:tRNA-dihydrouridine synthase [Thermoleophilia bacterium]
MATPGPPPSGTGPARSGPAGGPCATDPLLRPLAIGGLRLERRLFMAPMAGLTTSAFRRSVRRWGAGLVFTEMISAYGVHYHNRRTLDYFAHREDEHPLGFQLFGADADVLADAAGRAVAAGADVVDLNMACPVRKVVKTGAGAALLAEPDRAAAIVAAVVAAVEDAAPGRGVPVTVKIRSGLRDGDGLGSRAAPRLAAAGAAAVCIHPRTAAQLYRGRADHAVTFALAAALPVPVIASGDVDGREAALALLDGGAAAVMLARGAVGAPWLFAQVLGEAEPSAAGKLEEVRRFAAEVLEECGGRGVGHLRQFWPGFRRHGALDKALSLQLMQARDEAGLRTLLGL